MSRFSGDGFIPGLKARGHEEAAGIDLVEVLAALPRPEEVKQGRVVPILDQDAIDRLISAEEALESLLARGSS